MATLDDRVATMEGCVKLLTSIAERQQTLLKEVRRDARKTDARLEEARRDSAKTDRLWVRLCKRYGWLDELDDEDL